MSPREPRIIVNARALVAQLTGTQRYALELLSRFEGGLLAEVGRSARAGLLGHLWEQFYLPTMLSGRLLWSPSNTGPISVERQVVTLHDVVPLDHPEWFGRRFATWFRWIVPRLVRVCRRVITISTFSKERILHWAPVRPEKIEVIPNGVDARFGRASQADVVRVVGKFGLKPGRYVLSLSSVEPRKNLPRLLDAWRAIAPRLDDDLVLVVAGGAGNAAIYGRVAFGEIPRSVLFTGRIDDADLPALYAGALAFVYPSLYEGFGLPPLEAMACGVPVVAGNRASLPEVIGEAGILVDPGRTEEIGEGILSLIGNEALRQRLGAAGAARAAAMTWDACAGRTWRVLREAAGG